MKKIITLAAILFPVAASAFTPENHDLKYEAHWSGIKAGEMHVIIGEKDDSFNDTVTVDTVGVVKNLTKYWNANNVKGAIKNGKYSPEVYDSKWQQKKNTTQAITVTYAAGGRLTETAKPPESRSKHPEVSDKDKTGAVDPVTAGVTARQRVREIIQSKGKLPQKFTIKMFDGRRVSSLGFDVIGYQNMNIGAKSMKLLKVTMTRTAISGFNKKELDSLKNSDPVIDIYADDNFIPVYAAGHALIGEFTIEKVD